MESGRGIERGVSAPQFHTYISTLIQWLGSLRAEKSSLLLCSYNIIQNTHIFHYNRVNQNRTPLTFSIDDFTDNLFEKIKHEFDFPTISCLKIRCVAGGEKRFRIDE